MKKTRNQDLNFKRARVLALRPLERIALSKRKKFPRDGIYDRERSRLCENPVGVTENSRDFLRNNQCFRCERMRAIASRNTFHRYQ